MFWVKTVTVTRSFTKAPKADSAKRTFCKNIQHVCLSAKIAARLCTGGGSIDLIPNPSMHVKQEGMFMDPS